MDRPSSLEELLEFPCDYQFKAMGPNDEHGDFFRAVHAAVTSVVPVPLDAVKARPSSKGTFQSVTVLVRAHNVDQIKAIYAALHRVPDLKYLL